MSRTLRLRSALVVGASAIALSAGGQAIAATASADAGADTSSSGGGTTVGELVITAEKREQSLQDVPVAVSAFTSQKRDLVGINSIQDMTNFTPGLQYSTSTDRISLRGVGRLTNVLSADAAVANYNDGVYETFAVAAGRSTLFLDRVEVLRGPQGTLYGRNAIGGALNEISRKPTLEPYAEARIRYENYNHINLEAAVSGPLSDNVQFRVGGSWEKQSEGWIKSVTPGMPDEGNVIDEWFAEAQIQVKFNDRFDMWTKVAGAQWHNGAGGPGANSAAWTQEGGWPTYLYGTAATSLNPGFGCGPQATNVQTVGGIPLAQACTNPAGSTPWRKATGIPYKVYLPAYIGIASHWTWHADGFDIKYVTGGVYYHYQLTGSVPNGYADPPITAYTIPCATGPNGAACLFGGPLTYHPQEAFDYQEKNGFWSHEINFISTGEGPLQWVVGAYLFNQHYKQPVFTTAPTEPHWNNPTGAQGFFCAQTGGVCPPETGFRRFDNRPDVHARSEAVFGQIDWKFAEHWKTTLGLRYSWDHKWGTESVRLLCFAVPACFASPAQIGNFTSAVDLTQLPTVVSSPSSLATAPRGVTSLTTYDPATGLATRHYDSTWSAVTGTAGLEFTPDDDTLIYGKYSRGYKSGGFNIGIFTVLSFFPWTDKETVDSFELGLKREFGRTFQINAAAFYYSYKNLQIPITITDTSSGLAQSTTAFLNVPKAISRGFEAETIWSPIENLNILFNYSYLDAYQDGGVAVDSADPAALQPGATPVVPQSFCVANPTQCAADVYTVGLPNGGFQRPQSLKGNRLPNAPKNKVALNVTYTFRFDPGSLSLSGSYIWRDVQYGTLFTRWYNRAPSWDQVDLRATWKAANGKYTIIGFVKNVFNDLGYDNGAFGQRQAGSILDPVTGSPINFVQGVNGPAGYGAVPGVSGGVVKNYSVTPPRTYGVEFQYKFF